MPSDLASFKYNANMEGQDRNSQLETLLVFLSCAVVLKLKFLFDFFVCRVRQKLCVCVRGMCVSRVGG